VPNFGPAITPVVGHITSRLEDVPMRINHDEVEKVFTVSIERLIDQKYRGHTQFRAGTRIQGYSIPVYSGGEEKVWGMTGIITHLFLLSLLAKRDYNREIKYVKSYR
jgi:nudix motif 8